MDLLQRLRAEMGVLVLADRFFFRAFDISCFRDLVANDTASD